MRSREEMPEQVGGAPQEIVLELGDGAPSANTISHIISTTRAAAGFVERAVDEAG